MKKRQIDPKSLQTQFLPKRIDKTLDWFEKSRDIWKDKCLQAKLELKMKTLSVKRLHDGRDKWKLRAKQSAMIIQQLKNEKENILKECENLKKRVSNKD